MFRIKKTITLFVVMLTLLSCDSKDESFVPLYASAMQNGVFVSYPTTDGEELITSKEVLNTISIKGKYSKRDIPFEMKNIVDDGVAREVLCFNAELPRASSMKYNDDNSKGYGESVVYFAICGKTFPLTCKFVYSCSNRIEYGGTSLRLESVECDGISINEERNNYLFVDLSKFMSGKK